MIQFSALAIPQLSCIQDGWKEDEPEFKITSQHPLCYFRQDIVCQWEWRFFRPVWVKWVEDTGKLEDECKCLAWNPK